jgi:cation transport protein ChaC
MTKVNRSVLLEDGVRKAARAAGHGRLLMSDEDLARSLESTLAQHDRSQAVWIFAYGSLIWNPMLDVAEARRARIFGYHRGFYLWSKINRGTPAAPGLVLGLDRGGSCDGIAYRLHCDTGASELALLWRREMIMGTYTPRWVMAHSGGDAIPAIAFVVNRGKDDYAGRLSDDQIVTTALHSHGHYGSCADYLLQTAQSLHEHGITDTRLARLAERVRQHGPFPPAR